MLFGAARWVTAISLSSLSGFSGGRCLKRCFLPLGGRVWCLICPLPAPGEWLARKTITAVRYLEKPVRGLHHHFLGLNKDWPNGLSRSIWLQNVLFLVLISFGIILLTRPVATAILFLVILAATLGLSLVFRGRVFCLYLCPVGGFLSTYSMAACTELRAVDPEVCKSTKKNAAWWAARTVGLAPGVNTRATWTGTTTAVCAPSA